MRRGSIFFAFATSVLLSLVAFSQTKPSPTRSTPQTAPPSNGGPAAQSKTAPASNGESGVQGKIAIINTAAFRVGITELKVTLEALNKEFELQNKELEGLQKQIEDLKNKVQTQSPTVQPTVRNGWMEQGAELEKSLKRKSEDYQTLFQRRSQQLAGPVLEKINKFLGQYSEQRNIVMVLEREVAVSSNLLLWAAQVAEITEDFIKEYNKANPSAALVAPRK